MGRGNVDGAHLHLHNTHPSPSSPRCLLIFSCTLTTVSPFPPTTRQTIRLSSPCSPHRIRRSTCPFLSTHRHSVNAHMSSSIDNSLWSYFGYNKNNSSSTSSSTPSASSSSASKSTTRNRRTSSVSLPTTTRNSHYPSSAHTNNSHSNHGSSGSSRHHRYGSYSRWRRGPNDRAAWMNARQRKGYLKACALLAALGLVLFFLVPGDRQSLEHYVEG